MFEKAGLPGWPSIIPLYREYKLCEKVMGNGSYAFRLLLFLIPFIGWILGLYYAFQMYKATARAFGKPESWAWGYLFLTPIFCCITGFGDAEYYGPFGRDDYRTPQARAATTVDFDVRQNEPDPQTVYQPDPTDARVYEPEFETVKNPEEETVNFEFEQVE